MAGVNSPSDALTHLQHQQHSSLLGPSMQVRAPPDSPNFLHDTVSTFTCTAAVPLLWRALRGGDLVSYSSRLAG